MKSFDSLLRNVIFFAFQRSRMSSGIRNSQFILLSGICLWWKLDLAWEAFKQVIRGGSSIGEGWSREWRHLNGSCDSPVMKKQCSIQHSNTATQKHFLQFSIFSRGPTSSDRFSRATTLSIHHQVVHNISNDYHHSQMMKRSNLMITSCDCLVRMTKFHPKSSLYASK